MASHRPLQVGVIGPAGFGGSYLCLELINRGHTVIGISRRPETLGQHPSYVPRPADVNSLTIPELAQHFQGLDALVNEYGPHSAGHEALQYMPYLEVTRKIVLAARLAKVGYFVMVGGCGSLYMPNSGHQSVLENKDWWIAYRRGIADSEAHTAYMEERLGPMGSGLRTYRNARRAERENQKQHQNQNQATAEETRRVIDEYEEYVRRNDKALVFITACRTSFMFFDGNTSFRWTFVSPSALYRPGRRTGNYGVRFDYLPLKGDEDDPTNLDGRLHGISAADLAVAIADEIESPTKEGRHWSAYGDLSDDTPTPSYVKLEQRPEQKL
ncbi:hypothetical protein A1O3_03734 [Capronia epimyces CBS 606.96]|uniref:NAD(P)-binding domain-containing protein n=1 Tax=Capronia epimyces CBS 606.96 TaxID=1182542 RepID=W9YAU4_9EURO|nr:uncharacterized protein A1O3_03734 [Capronia epimyces CBS 606.96]EXJ86780.1 hypothetical protein A1O3_03734 [Capronia epimyces CBS 606.96]